MKRLTGRAVVGAALVVCTTGWFGSARGQGANMAEQAEQAVTSVSILRLVAHPETYHGKYVRVIGFARFEHEGNAVYLHREDFENALTKNGLWLSDDPQGETRRTCDQKYVLIEGTFDAQNTGHMGLWGGSIRGMKRLQVWSDPVKPIASKRKTEGS